MTQPCPDGYVPVVQAVEKAALCWFPEAMAALQTMVALGASKLKDDDVSGVSQSAGAFEISQALEQKREIRDETNRRLRNFCIWGY
jgi:hypothetical protein